MWVSMTFHTWAFRPISQLDLDGSRAWMKVWGEAWMTVMQMPMRVMPRLKLAMVSSSYKSGIESDLYLVR